jgi:hypothetical protein
MPETETLPPIFHPTPEEEQARMEDYGYLSDMRDLKLKPFPNFAGQNGQRSWLKYIDDSERVLNGYQLSREAQGKEDWQSNLMDNITLAKCRAIAAGVGLRVPRMTFDATNKNGTRSLKRAEIFKEITQFTFKDQNPSLHNFLELWQMLCHGSIFEYEGYRTGGAKVRKVKSFDSVTGDLEIEEQFTKFDGKPYSVILNPQDFYWWDMKVRDVQDQQRVAWVQIYSKRDIETEFSKYKNFKFVLNKTETLNSNLQDTLYFKKWEENVNDDDYEVFRIYDKERDVYRVWINGIPIIDAPLLWGGDEKIYPFSKQVNQPFANSNFFVGMSWPGILESYQDHKNTHINTLIDKTYRSMEAPMLVGLGNKDLFDIESQLVNQDNRYYVPDVNEVREMPIGGVNQGELAMLDVLNQGIELLSVDRSQQGISPDTQKTARQAIIDDARAQELKGTLYLALEDLWLQKTRLRVEIILTHFLKDKAARAAKRDQIISIKDYTFGDGERGVLDIHVARTKGSTLPKQQLENRATAMEEQGIAYKLISIPITYLTDWEYDFTIEPQSFHNQDRLAKEEELMSEIEQVGILDPNFLAANKKLYIERILELYGRNTSQYNPPIENPQQEGTLLGLEDNNATTNTSTEGGLPVSR